MKYLEENAYREVILRQRINEAAKAGMVAYAIKNDLEQLAANNNVERTVITPETIPKSRRWRRSWNPTVIYASVYRLLLRDECRRANRCL